MTDNSISTLKNILARNLAFSGLNDDNLSWLAKNCQPYHCSVGQSLLLPDRTPEYCYLIIEGRGRVLHKDPALQRPLTLAYSNPGDLIGWIGLARKEPCEWITAATPLKLIGFSSDIFYELEERCLSFATWIDTNNSPAELITILQSALRVRPIAEPNEREVLRQLLPCMSLLPARIERNLPNDDTKIWLWNVKPSGYDIEVGQPVDPQLLATIPSGQSLRLLSIDREAWHRVLEPRLFAPPQLDQFSQQDLWADDRYTDLLAPEPQGPLSGSADGSDISSNVSFKWKGQSIPEVTGTGHIGQMMACLEMLALFYNIPFRSDVIERAVNQSLQDKDPTLELLGNLSTLIGFTGSIGFIPTAQLSRLSFPCFAFVDNHMVMVHDVTRFEVKAVFPEYGRVSLPLETFTADQDGVHILSLTPGRDAQQRKLNFAWFLPQITKYRRSLIEVLVASLVLQLLNLAQPLVLQQIFDKVIGQQNLDTLYTLGMVLLGVSLFQGLIGAVRTYLFADTTNRIDISLGAEVIQHLLRLPLNYFDKRPVGELQTRLAELGNIRNFLTGTLLTLGLDALFSVIYIAVMVMYSGVLTAVTLGVIPLFLGLTIVASPAIRAQLRKAAERNAQTQALLIESLNGVQTIKAQNAENNIRWQWQRRYSAFMSESFRTLLIGVASGTIGTFLNQLTSLLTLWVGAFLVIKGDLTIGQLIAFRIISGYVVGPLLNLATSWQSFQGVALSLERLSDVLDSPVEGSDAEIDQLPLPAVAGDVSFQEVDFSFNEASPLVVKKVSFDIPSGSFIGIVGRSGSGKSTIMKLLPRLYTPSSGRILIDGFDISKLQLGSVRRQIGIVPQDSLLFDGSVRDNIALIAPNSTYDQIVAAARVACAHDFIMELPQGYATRVGEKGGSLSGGQRQRIAIARAVLQKPSLLILDEATSALDYLTERQVCVNLKRTFEGSTVFFITHRLTTIRSADQILMLDSGHLVEQGTHRELIDAEGPYFALYSQQESDIV